MKFGIKKENKIVFCYHGYTHSSYQLNEEIHLILSCEFYWVRKFKIPTKSLKEAKNTLPSLFEDILPEGRYDYSCIRLEENSYLGFAYDNDKILQMLKEANFTISSIKSIRFAQTEFEAFKDVTLQTNSQTLFAYHNDIFVKLPYDFVNHQIIELESLLSELKLSSFKIDFKFYTTVLDKKLLLSVAILCGVMVSMNGVKYFNLQSTISSYEEKKEQLREEYKLPATSIQMKSIFEELKQKDEKQRKLKALIADIFRFKTVSSEAVLVSIRYVKKNVNVVFENANENAIKTLLQKEYKIISSSKDSNLLTLEISYE